MACPSRSREWERVRSLEDLLAVLASAMGHQRVIRLHAWHEGDWGTVFVEVTAQGEDLARVQAELSARWAELYEEARDG